MVRRSRERPVTRETRRVSDEVTPLGRVLETAVYASDLDAAEWFYGTVLGLERFARMEGRHVFFRCGASVFLVFNPAATLVEGTLPAHGTSGPAHMAFAVAAHQLPAWRARLAQHGVSVEREITWPRGGQSLYVRDPAGNSIELASPAIWGLAEE
jgi:catechol 2,3-dioxygenase-like lactoylglutathione lyase family enzyme